MSANLAPNLALVEPLPVVRLPRTDTGRSPKAPRSKAKRARQNRQSAELSQEIERVEIEIKKCEVELGAWVSGDDVAFGRLFRIRTERLQLEAYLRGLRFARTLRNP